MDDLDYAQKNIEDTENLGIKKATAMVRSMPKGEQGDCELCGRYSPRIVYGACAPCRDKYKMW